MPLFYIAFYQLDVVTLRAEIVSLFMSEIGVGWWLHAWRIMLSFDPFSLPVSEHTMATRAY